MTNLSYDSSYAMINDLKLVDINELVENPADKQINSFLSTGIF